MDIAIIANGYSNDDSFVREKILSCEKKFAIDGGILHLDALGIIPDLWIGDFDSTPAHLEKKYHHLPKKAFSKDKIASDTELAVIEALEYQPERIFLFAGLGDRIDHSIANLFLLGKYAPTLYLVTEEETAFAFSKNMLLPSYPGQRLSFLPLFGLAKVSQCSGLRWSIEKMELSHTSLSLSNESIAAWVEIKLSKGILLCVAETRHMNADE